MRSTLLTGLHNRAAWDRLLEAEEKRCRRYGSPAGVLVIDLDGLEEINDAEGHAAGDHLLKRAAHVLREAVRETDVVARIDGDEFAILAPDESALAVEQLEKRLREQLREAGVKASVGSSRRDPRQTLTWALEMADEKMQADKETREGV